jgi:predicted nuclease of restriction endonuclease-like RecB superfamily
MLTGKLVRVRHAKNRLHPVYIDVTETSWREVAEHLLEVFRTLPGRTRAEAEEEIRETIGDNPTLLVHQGLAKLLDDRCEYEVDSQLVPDEIREKVFLAAAAARKSEQPFERTDVLKQVAQVLSVSVEEVDQALFADLKSEQRIVKFHDLTIDQLLHRYNTALVQSILLRATNVTVRITGETPVRYRQLFRAIKFHRLICDIRPAGPDTYQLHLDGPLSLFSATQKYGLQLANFLPTLLQCKSFELSATVRWGADRKEKTFLLNSGQGLRSHTIDYGNYIPRDLIEFAEAFRNKVTTWQLVSDVDIITLPSGFWTPDFQLIRQADGAVVFLEVLGFWRKSNAEQIYRRLTTEFRGHVILAVSDQFNIDETLGEEWGGNIYRFKRTPLPNEIVKLAEACVPLKTPSEVVKPKRKASDKSG